MSVWGIIGGILGLIFLIWLESKTHLIRTLWKIFMG